MYCIYNTYALLYIIYTEGDITIYMYSNIFLSMLKTMSLP